LRLAKVIGDGALRQAARTSAAAQLPLLGRSQRAGPSAGDQQQVQAARAVRAELNGLLDVGGA